MAHIKVNVELPVPTGDYCNNIYPDVRICHQLKFAKCQIFGADLEYVDGKCRYRKCSACVDSTIRS